MDLDLEQVIVLAVTAVAVAPLIWVERRSRKNRRNEALAATNAEPTQVPDVRQRQSR